MPDLTAILPELPRLAHECYIGPWAFEYEDCRAVLTRFGDVTVAAIPGTHGASDIGDLLADGLLAVEWYAAHFGWVPEGSYRRAMGLYGLLKPALSGPVVLTGHSLGGAFAQVLAVAMAADGTPPVWLETYGAPHSAGGRMAILLDGVNGLAYETRGDPIPHATFGMWQPWKAPTMLGAEGTPTSIGRHFMQEYADRLALATA